MKCPGCKVNVPLEEWYATGEVRPGRFGYMVMIRHCNKQKYPRGIGTKKAEHHGLLKEGPA